MSRNYDNWERLVAAVLKKEQLWQLFHAQSSPSISSESSDFSLSLGLSSSLDDVPFSFSSPVSSVPVRKGDDNGGNETVAAAPPSRILVKNQSPVETLATKMDLRIQVPKPQIQYYGVNSPIMATPIQSLRAHPRGVVENSESRTNNSPDDAKQQSYPLPLPPEATSDSSPFSRPNSASISPKVPLHSPEGAKNHKSTAGTSWKRGKLLGNSAFGNVYFGFNSEKGKMCAMKEFNLYYDGATSKQSSSPVVLPSPKVELLRKRIRVPTFLGFPTPTIAAPLEIADHIRAHLQLDPGTLASHPSRVSKSNFQPSDISTPVSPVVSPFPHPRSPLTGRDGAIQYPHLNQSLLPPETFHNLPRHSTGISGPSYWDPNILRKVHSAGDNDRFSSSKAVCIYSNLKSRNK